MSTQPRRRVRSSRTDDRLDHLLRGLKQLADTFEPGYHTHGPMRIQFYDPPSGKEAPWRMTIEAGWDHQFGGRIVVEASKTGKSLRIWRDDRELA